MEKEKTTIAPKGKRYIYGKSGRKTSTCQCRLYKKGSGKITVNDKDWKEYFPTENLQIIITNALAATGHEKDVDLSLKVHGGGKHSQAEASRHGMSRALELMDGELRPVLKAAGYLKRDPRVKERKKPGLKRARRAPQWSKR
jgi:small subunit ribosomal protein S9